MHETNLNDSFPAPFAAFQSFSNKGKQERHSTTQSGVRQGSGAPLSAQDSVPNTGVKTKQHKTPSPTTAILTVGTGVPWHFSSRDSACPLEGGQPLAPRCFCLLCKCALGSTLPARLHLQVKPISFSVRHTIHTESCVQGPDNVFIVSRAPRASSYNPHMCVTPAERGLPDVAACAGLHAAGGGPGLAASGPSVSWWFRTSLDSDTTAFVIIHSPFSLSFRF